MVTVVEPDRPTYDDDNPVEENGGIDDGEDDDSLRLTSICADENNVYLLVSHAHPYRRSSCPFFFSTSSLTYLPFPYSIPLTVISLPRTLLHTHTRARARTHTHTHTHHLFPSLLLSCLHRSLYI
jgi:hypothetical protein